MTEAIDYARGGYEKSEDARWDFTEIIWYPKDAERYVIYEKSGVAIMATPLFL